MIGRFFLASTISAMAVSFSGCQGPTGNIPTTPAPSAAISDAPAVVEAPAAAFTNPADEALGPFPSSGLVYRNTISVADLIGSDTFGQFAQKREIDSFEIVNEPTTPPIRSVQIPSDFSNDLPPVFDDTRVSTQDLPGTRAMAEGIPSPAADASSVRLIPGVPTRQQYLDWIKQTGLSYTEARPKEHTKPAAPASKVGTAAKPAVTKEAVTAPPKDPVPTKEVVPPATTDQTEVVPVVPVAPAAADVVPEAVPGESRTHKVEKDENLWIIAKKYYGRGADWQKILTANKDSLSSPDKLTPGMNLVIP